MKRLMQHPRFSGVALSVLALMVAPIAACGGSGPYSIPTVTLPPLPAPIPIAPCTVTPQTPTPAAFRGGGGFDAISIPAARTLPGSQWDSGYTVVQDVNSVTLSQPATPTSGQIQGAHVAQRVGLAASVGHLSSDVSSSLCSGTVQVSCQQSAPVLGGGFDIRSTTGVSVVASYPSSTNTWTVTLLDGSSIQQTVTTYAGCVTPVHGYPPLVITISHTAVPVKPNDHPPDIAVATCPSGSGLALDGGFMLNLPKKLPRDATLNVIASYPTTSPAPTPTPSGGATPNYNEWAVQAHASPEDVSEVAYVECESTSTYGPYPVSIQSSSFTVAPNSSTVTGHNTIPSSMCPKYYALTGGGFSTNDTDDHAADTEMVFQLDNGMVGSGALTQWDVVAFNNGSTPHTATVYAVCV